MSLDIAELVLSLLPDGAEGEVSVDRQELALTRFANSFIHQNVADVTTEVRLRVHADGRTLAGSTTVANEDGLRALVARTVEGSRLAPRDPHWPGLSAPAALRGNGAFDPATVDASPADRAARVASFVDSAGGFETAGYCRTLHWSGAFANSAGQSVTGASTEAAMDGIARADGADGVARIASAALSTIDGAVLGARAAAKARAGIDPVELPPGRYEVVLEPQAVADILQNLAAHGFNGKAYQERRSFAVLGEQQFDSSITLVDDPLDGTAAGLPYDAEGTPKRRLALAEAGVSRAVTHDRRTAALTGDGAESTGHALSSIGPWGPIAHNLGIVAPMGGSPAEVAGPVADSSVAALVAGVRHGLLVTDFWYTRVLDPKTLAITGLTRNGVWLIEDGEVTRPVRNFRFTQAYGQALGSGNVLGIGAYAVPQPNAWGSARWSAPALHLASWNFTGGASG
ncbi:MAG TPA: metallopeptidase TldD-related protein [Micromonosporaceae bacterium]|jgi:predicted Zn-dependent protease|nr:metallopeptidase TldD-related protein [Micromonosporaceae bacterium]